MAPRLTFVYSLIHKYLLNAYDGPSTVPGAGDASWIRQIRISSEVRQSLNKHTIYDTTVVISGIKTNKAGEGTERGGVGVLPL